MDGTQIQEMYSEMDALVAALQNPILQSGAARASRGAKTPMKSATVKLGSEEPGVSKTSK